MYDNWLLKNFVVLLGCQQSTKYDSFWRVT